MFKVHFRALKATITSLYFLVIYIYISPHPLHPHGVKTTGNIAFKNRSLILLTMFLWTDSSLLMDD